MSSYGIVDVLDEIRAKAFTEYEKGASFERLMKQWFLSDPLYANSLETVWLWEEFPARRQLGGHDLGIDLVAKTIEGDYWAIQCKCFAKDTRIDEGMVANFLSNSSRVFSDGEKNVKFSHRIWVATTNKWSANAEEMIQNQDPPVTRITLDILKHSSVDWKKLANGHIGKDALLAGKQLRKHQIEAIAAAEKYYADHDRGKLIMACGTGKTFTSLRLVEQLVGDKGLVLFMVPSIGLLGQALNDWCGDAKKPIKAICICSDNKASRRSARSSDDDSSGSVVDLAMPASTNTSSIVNQLKRYKDYDGLVVVFSTYQSIDVISDAQSTILYETKGGYGVFDFIICDEAHRTTGARLSSKDESNFTMIHDDENVRGKKRLYMTATPKLFGQDLKVKLSKIDCVLCSMDDPKIYGDEFFRVNFSYAVQNGILTDYKVLVLTVSEDMIPKDIIQDVKDKRVTEINYDDAGRLVGVISGLSKRILGDNGRTKEEDPKLMRRALAFTPKIGSENVPGSSKNIEHILPIISQKYSDGLQEDEKKEVVHVTTRHVDGSMSSLERSEALSWLSEEAEDPQECRVITNVRCLSEGIDVPALDAILFLSARTSKVDIVQSVGRVMRSFGKGTDKEKKYGYIIIPIVVPEGVSAVDALNDNKSFSVVWDILNALRSHDDHFNAIINSIELNKGPNGKIVVVSPQNSIGQVSEADATQIDEVDIARQLNIHFADTQDAIFAKIVEKCGDRLYWENWAASVGDIARKYIERIKRLVRVENNSESSKEFGTFVATLQKNLNPGIDEDQCIEMLAQHMITRPVFEALFADYKFIENNSISKSMQSMIDKLESESVYEENNKLQKFYDSVRTNIGKIDNLAGKQTIIKTLYEKFFKRAFPLTVETLGTVYTPVECVDFIICSVDAVLKNEFDTAITNNNVQILDPFVGTGTFITRLLQLGIIEPDDLRRKYEHEIHCNEIVLLAYYIADVNIESVFHEMYSSEQYVPFDGICLTDTFQLGEIDAKGSEGNLDTEFFAENSETVERQRQTKVRVIIGNPPYSVGQKSANDNAQNQSYPHLEQRISETYAARSTANLSKSLYDSYIKAFRWSTDRIDENEGGVIAFISNGAWIDGNSQDGFRATIAKEFDKIYVFNLRGNCRTQGELRRKEGDGIFGLGSRTPIAITLLVKYPKERHSNEKCEILYHDIGDYLSREKKLDIINKFGSIEGIKWDTIIPNEKNDWINQRDGVFDNLIPLTPDKNFKANSQSIFSANVIGVSTNRDVWVSGFSKEAVGANMRSMIDFYNENIGKGESSDETRISWTRALRRDLQNKTVHAYDDSTFVISAYRPFNKIALYYHRPFIECPGRWGDIFPMQEKRNIVIVVAGAVATMSFSCFITNNITDLHFSNQTQCFPLYWYKEKETRQLDLFTKDEKEYVRHDGITDWALKEIRSRFAGARSLTKEDIFYYVYGLLHSPDYRSRFADDLRKALPRIPIVERVEEFIAFSKAGRQLAQLHLDYEDVAPYPDVVVDYTSPALDDERAYDYFAVPTKMRFISKEDKSCIIYNEHITISNIPAKAYEYIVNGKSAIEWIVERYCVSQDKKSGICNDCNAWAREHNKPRYILDLLLSVINASVQTVDIVNALPRLNIDSE